MFTIESISLHNFMSYGGQHDFDFPAEPGLYYLTGRNDDESRLGANGVGKSTLLAAIYWCFYGVTPRGLKAGDIITWGEKTADVWVRVVIDGKSHVIARHQSPNSLVIDEEVVEQSAVNKLLRLSPEAFLYSIIIPQFGDSFFDLKPTEKLNLFSQIMDLDYWLTRSDKAAQLVNRLEAKATKYEREIASEEARIDTLEQALNELKGKEADFELAMKARIKELKAKKADAVDAIEELKPQIKRATIKAAELKSRLEEAKKADRAHVDKVADNRSQRILKSERVNELGNVAKSIAAEHEGIAKLKGRQCPTCGQKVSFEHIRSHNQAAEKEVKKLLDQIREGQNELERMKVQGDKLLKQGERLHEAAQEAEEEYTTVGVAEQSLIRERNNLEAALAEVDDTIKEARERENPYSEMIEKRRSEVKQSKADRKELQDLLTQNRSEHELAAFWVKGFKRVRLFVVEEALTQLEVEVNNNLTQLGLTDWSIKFDIERENKSGGVTKGFTVLVQNPRTDQPVKWESWSGGETQRLRLAGDLGLANLIMDRAGLQSKIEFHDEPSEHLSTEGIEDMLDTLYERAHNEGKVIWLCDHHVMSFGEFSGILTAVMKAGGTTELWYEEGAYNE